MAINFQLRTALKRAASTLTGREISEVEAEKLDKVFEQSAGTNFQKALQALTEVTELSRPEIMQKSAASDNTDRIMKDLEDAAKNWTSSS